MTGLNLLYRKLVEFLDRKFAGNRRGSVLLNVLYLALFGLGLFLAYLRFTRTL
ncbi:MAG: hypothetical protein KDK10_08170 [Maritimibacter sp.]|nr:hypothetical protein [Maritimibacter sp.]